MKEHEWIVKTLGDLEVNKYDIAVKTFAVNGEYEHIEIQVNKKIGEPEYDYDGCEQEFVYKR